MSRKIKEKATNSKYKTEMCSDEMSFDDCELAILRHAVDESDIIMKKKIVNSPDVNKIINVLESFLRNKGLICYGGTAINNILPKSDQFYDKELDIPDYDFYSPSALEDAVELADIYYKLDFKQVEAKAGVHHGTYKVFVNFIPIADITFIEKKIFNSIKAESINMEGILYAPANFLRMNMYLELSRPAGDVSRWEKILKRLVLLNANYPIEDQNCSKVEFQRELTKENSLNHKTIFECVRDTFINDNVVFFGGYATTLYSEYMPLKHRRLLSSNPDFDVLSMNPLRTATIVCMNLKGKGIKTAFTTKHESIGEIIPLHYEIRIGKETVAFIYQPIACHSYNTIDVNGKSVNVATIDTMLAFYLAFYYMDKPYYFQDRIMCMTNFLFEVEQRNRLEQKGLLKRFTISCYGNQKSLSDLRSEKSEMHKTLKVGSKEYQSWFLNYVPGKKKRFIPNNARHKSKLRYGDNFDKNRKTRRPPRGNKYRQSNSIVSAIFKAYK